MLYLWVKVFHVVFFVSWMAGLFYLPRLFVYHAESLGAEEPRRGILGAQFLHMERRLFGIIMQPAMVLTWLSGATMVALSPAFLRESWLWLKVTLIVLLTAYHLTCRRTITRFERGTISHTGEWYRVFNEAPTVVLVLAAALVLFKGVIRLSALAALLLGTVAVIVVGFRAYAAFRRRRGELVDSRRPPSPSVIDR
jgi:protoporphyrinogen IX oxidase